MPNGRDWRSGFNELPIIGGTLSGIWGDPAEEANAAAMEQAAQAYRAYRPEAFQARMNAFQNMSNAFGPMNNLMSQMYGPGAQMDMSKIVQNPFSEEYTKNMQDPYFQKYGMTKEKGYEESKKQVEKQAKSRFF